MVLQIAAAINGSALKKIPPAEAEEIKIRFLIETHKQISM